MKERCFNDKVRGFKNYGGRGITVSEEWMDFTMFANDMYDSFVRHVKKHGYTSLDRMDVNGNYEKSNCRWATRKVQAKNTRKRSVPLLRSPITGRFLPTP